MNFLTFYKLYLLILLNKSTIFNFLIILLTPALSYKIKTNHLLRWFSDMLIIHDIITQKQG